jgi:hypothetical protein
VRTAPSSSVAVASTSAGGPIGRRLPKITSAAASSVNTVGAAIATQPRTRTARRVDCSAQAASPSSSIAAGQPTSGSAPSAYVPPEARSR